MAWFCRLTLPEIPSTGSADIFLFESTRFVLTLGLVVWISGRGCAPFASARRSGIGAFFSQGNSCS